MARTLTGENSVEGDSQRQRPAQARLKVGDDPDLRVLGGSETKRGEGSKSLGFGLVGPACWAARGEGALGLRNGTEERSEDWAGWAFRPEGQEGGFSSFLFSILLFQSTFKSFQKQFEFILDLDQNHASQ